MHLEGLHDDLVRLIYGKLNRHEGGVRHTACRLQLLLGGEEDLGAR